jgi:ribonuclease P protein component
VASAQERLKRRAEFLRAAARGRKTVTPGIVVQCYARGDGAPVRLGFTVTKKVGNAVMRNRTRRRLKEAARLALRDVAGRAQVPAGVDLVLIGRNETAARPFAALIGDLLHAIGRLGLA